MNTEITDNVNARPGNWVCYDANCALCLRWVRRLRTSLERQGFTLLPLQSPGVRAFLKLPETDLLTEMRVVTRYGIIIGGGDAVIYLARKLFWPLHALSLVPGIKPLIRAVYRFIAQRRTCNSLACEVRPKKSFGVGNPADWLPLLLMVVVAAVVGRHFPPWIYMWLLAASMFAGAKWLVFREALRRAANASLGRKLGFLFGWIGMDATEFFEARSTEPKPQVSEWLFADLKVLTGALLVWVLVRYVYPLNAPLAGWIGMIGLILILHFGVFHLLALAWRRAGIRAKPLMRAPLLSRSLGEFWGERWNTAFNYLAARFILRPLRHEFGVPAATMAVFLISGLIHDLILSIPARGGYGLPTLYFLLQGGSVLFERTRLARQFGLNHGLRSRFFTILMTAGPVFWLFHPRFVRNIILPMLHALGAT